MKRGIMGGTFDPPHIGHLMLAEEAKKCLALDEVIFIPAGEPWAKASLPVSPAAERLEMVRLAISGKPDFEISDIEIKRLGPSYTWETLEELHNKYPSDELYFILGWDNLTALPSWHKPRRIISAAHLAAAHRIGFAQPDLEALEKLIPGIGQRTVIMTGPEIDISASTIRQRVKKGLPIDHLVPPPVAEYIVVKGLYKTG